MREWVSTCLLREEAIASYEEHHADAWPDVVASLRATGVQAVRIYRLGPRLVIVALCILHSPSFF